MIEAFLYLLLCLVDQQYCPPTLKGMLVTDKTFSNCKLEHTF